MDAAELREFLSKNERADPERLDSLTRRCVRQPPQHEADHAEANESSDGCCVAFEVAHEATVSADPGECPLHNPALWQHDEASQVGPFDDLDFPATSGCHGLRSLISSVGKDIHDERETPPSTLQQTPRAIAILNVCR